MFRDAADRSGMDVAGQTDLQRNSLIEDVLRQRAHIEDHTFLDPHVFDQPCAMSDTMRAAPLNRLPDGFLAKSFTGVDRDVEVLALNVVKGVDVFLCRIAAFFAREIETHHAMRPEIGSKLRHFLGYL